MANSRDVADELEALVDEVDAEATARQLYQLRDRNRRLSKENRDLSATLDALSGRVAVLEELRADPPKVKVKRPRKRAKDAASFVALFSDWHTHEIVTPSRSYGNEHNSEIGHERAWECARGVVALCKREQQTRSVERLVVWLGGDFLTNDDMHYKSERVVDISPHAEARASRDLLAQILGYFRAELDVPEIVVPTSVGNHGRSTQRMVDGQAVDYSFEQDIYLDLESWFAADPSFRFEVADAEWYVCDVGGYRLLFHHGHSIGYGSGLAGLAYPLRKAIASQSVNLEFETLCIGHYHQMGIYHGSKAITNGSLVGMNNWGAAKKFAGERPAQAAFVIDHAVQQIANFYWVWGD